MVRLMDLSIQANVMGEGAVMITKNDYLK